MISISLGLPDGQTIELEEAAGLILTGLTSGEAQPGALLQVFLPEGLQAVSYAWGSAPGLADYGAGQALQVPGAAADGNLHVTVSTGEQSFSAIIPVLSVLATTTINAAPNAILVLGLNATPGLPALTARSGPDTIIVETL
ncbi:MAG: hypothetical protein ACPGSW_00130 [Phaeobacter italicus]